MTEAKIEVRLRTSPDCSIIFEGSVFFTNKENNRLLINSSTILICILRRSGANYITVVVINGEVRLFFSF